MQPGLEDRHDLPSCLMVVIIVVFVLIVLLVRIVHVQLRVFGLGFSAVKRPTVCS